MHWVMRSLLGEAVKESPSIPVPGTQERWRRDSLPVETGPDRKWPAAICLRCATLAAAPSKARRWRWGSQGEIQRSRFLPPRMHLQKGKPKVSRSCPPPSFFCLQGDLGWQFRSSDLEGTSLFGQKIQLLRKMS